MKNCTSCQNLNNYKEDVNMQNNLALIKGGKNQLERVFNYGAARVRTVAIDGEPWFVAKDVCEVLEIANPTQALLRLDNDERAMFNIGRQGEANVINEPGLYSLILRSRKPEAKAFKRWVVHEVLPAIRKTGTFSVGQQRINQTSKMTMNIKANFNDPAVRKRLSQNIHVLDTVEKKPEVFKTEKDVATWLDLNENEISNHLKKRKGSYKTELIAAGMTILTGDAMKKYKKEIGKTELMYSSMLQFTDKLVLILCMQLYTANRLLDNPLSPKVIKICKTLEREVLEAVSYAAEAKLIEAQEENEMLEGLIDVKTGYYNQLHEEILKLEAAVLKHRQDKKSFCLRRIYR